MTDFTENRLKRIAANYPRLNSLLVSTHDVKWAVDEIDRLRAAVARAEDEHAHDRWASCGCLGGFGVGHAPDSPECPFPAAETAR